MEMVSKCRCCLTKGLHKDLNLPYIFLNKTEIYGKMLGDCFNIQLLSSPYASNSICDECIKFLQAAVAFKRQVMQAEDALLDMINKGDEELENIIKVDMKLEPQEYSFDGDGVDSDDYTLAETIKQEADKQKEPEPKSEGCAKKSVVTVSKKSGIKITFKKIAPQPSVTLNAVAVPVKLNIRKKEDKSSNSQMKLKCRSNKARKEIEENPERRHNLKTIFKYTNVTPFKTSSPALLNYECVFCRESFDSPETLRIHFSENHKKLTHLNVFSKDDYWAKVDIHDLTCTICLKKFDSISNICDHIQIAHSIKFNSNVKDHIIPYKLNKVDNLYECALCTCRYETYRTLTIHMNGHYSNYVCDICGATFVTKHSKSSHEKTHENVTCKCDTCGKIFKNQMRLKYHTKRIHGEVKAIGHCNICGIAFNEYYQRNLHMVKVHNLEARYKCNVCTRTFLVKTRLMYHVKKDHLMEKNVPCPECGKRFFSNKHLKNHMVKHTGEKNFVCSVCNKAYGRRSTLREHMRIHNNDKRFKCDVCQMMFVQKYTLRSHLLSNHGIRLQASEISVNVETADGVEQ